MQETQLKNQNGAVVATLCYQMLLNRPCVQGGRHSAGLIQIINNLKQFKECEIYLLLWGFAAGFLGYGRHLL